MPGQYDYGSAATVALAVPQANPTVEAEMHILLSPAILVVTARLVSRKSSATDRLKEYLETAGDTLARFDTLHPAVCGFACTGSSYLFPPDVGESMLARLQEQLGYPVISATNAIDEELRRLGARRLALLSPYPPALTRAACPSSEHLAQLAA